MKSGTEKRLNFFTSILFLFSQSNEEIVAIPMAETAVESFSSLLAGLFPNTT
jgi:hypothetical protein